MTRDPDPTGAPTLFFPTRQDEECPFWWNQPRFISQPLAHIYPFELERAIQYEIDNIYNNNLWITNKKEQPI